jgi:hypothetical protein
MDRRPSPAIVIALLAFAVAIGGTAYAASNLPSHSVGARQLKKGAVTKPKIAKKTLAALHGAAGPQGSTGPQGVTGPTGATGVQGLQGPGATSISTTVPNDGGTHTVATIDGMNVTVQCTGTTSVDLGLANLATTTTLQVSGTFYGGTSVFPMNANNVFSVSGNPTATEDLDVIARNTAVANNFDRFDFYGQKSSGGSNPCVVWGMITPSTFSP